MSKIQLTRKNQPPVDISEEDFILNILNYLRENFPREECVIYEIRTDGKRNTEEGAAAVLSLLRNPQLVNHYNKIVKNRL